MALFQDDEDFGFQELDTLSVFTPGKYEKKADITPVIRRIPAICQDEDSGLGMDDDVIVKETHSDTIIARPNCGDQPSSCSDDIKAVVNRLVEKDNLVSDGSGQLRLPTVTGKHNDLNNISHQTMADILQGDFDNVINNYRIIDCRYPYEYEGGHIKGAENIYTHDGIIELLHRDDVTSDGSRPIIIFHCEFSSERGPKLCRYLRSKDREVNADNYPHLNYPEIYLLYGGYKEFYFNHKELCDPISYKPMLHSDHADDLRHFRSKSKSWTAGEKRRKRTQRLRF
ncbi:hypothetical protein KUTeg_005296 [Tegillarca granosa]|uniref:M-phase inducer phosphatase n=1 Tax=Tegillarca granosa TaxID=220873 RepID=A0ABQ9FJB4_TEGGR|nr:hypothetical protein KUTeg_005296 [Tegillarca granosa]